MLRWGASGTIGSDTVRRAEPDGYTVLFNASLFVLGKTVPDISLNAIANLGYADGRILRPVEPGDTLRASSEVIGVKENSNGKTGVVWVRTKGANQYGDRIFTSQDAGRTWTDVVARGFALDAKGANWIPDDALITRLTALHGIGRWTVEMMLIYTLGRTDLLPADDLGVREGYRRLRRLDRPPTPRQMTALALPWSPHRTAASWYLWRVPR